jgi:large subunit ribosomal protein L25
MEEFTLSVASRNSAGSASCRGARRQGLIPGVVYGGGEPSMLITVDKNEFTKLATKASASQLFTLKSEDKTLNGKLAVVKEVQKDYLSQSAPIHIDFLALRPDAEFEIEVPVRIVGEAKGVKLSGGVLSVALHRLAVSCLPKNIPQRLEVDVTGIDLNESLQAKDVKLPEGVRLAGDPAETIASVVTIRIVEEAAPAAAAAAAPAEGAAAPAEGAAAAADGAAKADAAKAPAAKK